MEFDGFGNEQKRGQLDYQNRELSYAGARGRREDPETRKVSRRQFVGSGGQCAMRRPPKSGAKLTPEGLGGFEPLPLSQASGLAGSF